MTLPVIALLLHSVHCDPYRPCDIRVSYFWEMKSGVMVSNWPKKCRYMTYCPIQSYFQPWFMLYLRHASFSVRQLASCLIMHSPFRHTALPQTTLWLAAQATI